MADLGLKPLMQSSSSYQLNGPFVKSTIRKIGFWEKQCFFANDFLACMEARWPPSRQWNFPHNILLLHLSTSLPPPPNTSPCLPPPKSQFGIQPTNQRRGEQPVFSYTRPPTLSSSSSSSSISPLSPPPLSPSLPPSQRSIQRIIIFRRTFLNRI